MDALCARRHCHVGTGQGQTQTVGRVGSTPLPKCRELLELRSPNHFSEEVPFPVWNTNRKTSEKSKPGEVLTMHFWTIEMLIAAKQNLKRICCFQTALTPMLQLLAGGWCLFQPCYFSTSWTCQDVCVGLLSSHEIDQIWPSDQNNDVDANYSIWRSWAQLHRYSIYLIMEQGGTAALCSSILLHLLTVSFLVKVYFILSENAMSDGFLSILKILLMIPH